MPRKTPMLDMICIMEPSILYQMLRITIQVERLLAVESYRPRNAAPHVQP
ncbi:hypothetical protein GGP99_003569, partial [Salinibacter ruber]|nr:hypothetical protein [Salinibacter ruber]